MLSVADEDAQRNAQEKLDILIQGGLDSGPSTPMMAQDWQDIRLSRKRLVPTVPSHSDDFCKTEEYP